MNPNHKGTLGDMDMVAFTCSGAKFEFEVENENPVVAMIAARASAAWDPPNRLVPRRTSKSAPASCVAGTGALALGTGEEGEGEEEREPRVLL